MIKTSAAYSILATILGSRLVNRSRTLREPGEPVKVFNETLLLIPKQKASAIGMPENAEVYVDKKTKEEFLAVRVSATKPRNKVRVPAPPENPMMQVRPIIGQGMHDPEHGWGIAVCSVELTEQDKDIMRIAQIRIANYAQLSNYRYNQIVSQLDFAAENQRLHEIHMLLRSKSTPTKHLGLLQAVPATEQDSVRLLSYSPEHRQTYMQLTPLDEAGTFVVAVPSDGDYSLHSSTPLQQRQTIEPADKIAALGIDKRALERLEKEFDAKEPR